MNSRVLGPVILFLLLLLAFVSPQRSYGQANVSAAVPLWARTPSNAAGTPANARTPSLDPAIRNIRSNAFSDRAARQAGGLESGVQVYSHGYEVAMSAIPVRESDAVVVGNISGYQGFFCADHSCIYTELTVSVEESMKGFDTQRAGSLVIVAPGGAINVGGRIIRYPAASWARSLDVGNRYVLFLRYNPKTQAYSVSKAWGLRSGSVIPLSISDRHAAQQHVSTYAQATEAEFLSAVRSAAEQNEDR